MKIAGIVMMILILYSVVITYYALVLRHRIATSKDWRLGLSRKERRKYALEQKDRDQEAYELTQQEKLQDVIFPERKKAYQPTHNEGISS